MHASEVHSFRQSTLRSMPVILAAAAMIYGVEKFSAHELEQSIQETRTRCTSVLEAPTHPTVQWKGKMPLDRRSKAFFYQVKAPHPNGGTDICEAINDANDNPVALNFCTHPRTDFNAPQRCDHAYFGDRYSDFNELPTSLSDIHANIVRVVSSESP